MRLKAKHIYKKSYNTHRGHEKNRRKEVKEKEKEIDGEKELIKRESTGN